MAMVATDAEASQCDEASAAWLMCEDFEQGALGWQDWYAQSQWVECDGCSDGVNDPDRIALDGGEAHDGGFSLHMPGTSSEFTGGTLRFATCAGDDQQSGCALQGHDRLHFRTWVRLAADHDYVHHFIGIGGSRPDAYWDANGNAGCRPNGERWAGTRVDLNPEHELFFYTYHPDMSCDAGGYCSGDYAEQICDGCAGIDMPCTDGLECCWGNHFSPEPPVVVPTETWTCLEMMMEINTPGATDGRMAFWVDDVLAHEVDGLRWRDVPELQLNRAMLEHYIDVGDTDHPNAAWFDDVVVSTERIGCSASFDPGGSTGGVDTGGDDDGPSDTGPSDEDTADDPDSETNGDPSAAPTSAGDSASDEGGSVATDDPTAAADTSPFDDDGSNGCGCRSDGGGPSGLAWLGAAVLALVRRRRARAAAVSATLAIGCAQGDPSGSDGDDSTGDAVTDTTTTVATTASSTVTTDDADGTTDTTDTTGADTTTAPDVDSSSSGGSTGALGCVEYEPWFYDGFESHAVDESLSNNDPFDAAGRTRATDEIVHHGERSARMEILPEDGGGFGQWGGVLPLPDLGVGRSVWVRLWIWWPASFDFSASPWMKFIRLHNITAAGENGGYNDLYVDNADGQTSVLRVIKEFHDLWETHDGPPLPREQWERYEMQIVVDHVPVDDGGQARFRVWRDDDLIFDRTDVPTITAAGGVLDYVYLFTYWNNEMPPHNTVYMDDLTIALDDAPPPEADAAGNARLGEWLPCE
jgi:MYXO-CTERM domain-containing protein